MKTAQTYHNCPRTSTSCYHSGENFHSGVIPDSWYEHVSSMHIRYQKSNVNLGHYKENRERKEESISH